MIEGIPHYVFDSNRYIHGYISRDEENRFDINGIICVQYK